MPRPLDGLDLNLLVTLQALLAEESVTGAARRLGQTQPSVSRALATLRDAFGDPLLVRAGRGMVLTPFAVSLREPLDQTLGGLDRLRRVGAFDPETDERTFGLITPDVVGVGLVPLLRRAMPAGLSLVVLGAEMNEVGALLRDEVDVVVAAPRFEHPELRERRISAEGMPWSVVYGASHPAWPGDGLDLDGWLASEHLQLIPRGDPGVPSELDEVLHGRGLARTVTTKAAYLAAVGPLLEQSALVTSLPTPAARALAVGRPLRVAPHPLEGELPRVHVWMTWHGAQQADAGHRWLRERVVEAFGLFLSGE